MKKSGTSAFAVIPKYEENEEKLPYSLVDVASRDDLRELIPNAFSNGQGEADMLLVDSGSSPSTQVG